MDGRNGNANEDRAVLERIVALLFALAGLAEMAAGLPFLRRREVLGILASGEAAAWSLLTGIAPDTASGERARVDAPADAPNPSLRSGGSAGRARPVARPKGPRSGGAGVRLNAPDAVQLAARLRALALVLATFLAHAAFSAPPRAAGPHDGGRRPARQACRQVTSPAPDTS